MTSDELRRLLSSGEEDALIYYWLNNASAIADLMDAAEEYLGIAEIDTPINEWFDCELKMQQALAKLKGAG